MMLESKKKGSLVMDGRESGEAEERGEGGRGHGDGDGNEMVTDQ